MGGGPAGSFLLHGYDAACALKAKPDFVDAVYCSVGSVRSSIVSGTKTGQPAMLQRQPSAMLFSPTTL